MGIFRETLRCVAVLALIGGLIIFSQSASAAAANKVHPAFWKVENVNGTSKVYLFGSYHILRRGIQWVTPALVAAMAESDEFIFEVQVTPEPMKDAQAFIDSQGYLPEGKTLRGLLSPEVLKKYQDVVRSLPLDIREMDKLRPWLAQLTLSSSHNVGRKFSVVDGADVRIFAYALTHKKSVNYLETPRQQLEYFADAAAASESTEVQGFESLISSFDSRPQSMETAIAAWTEGDVYELGMRLHRGLADNPHARKILLDDRNLSWASQIEAMLGQDKTYFVTVGVGHLGGPLSVIEILCTRGWSVERLPTAGEAVDPACSPEDFAP
jgi:uncharacterized protein YbaP (TraB family)